MIESPIKGVFYSPSDCSTLLGEGGEAKVWKAEKQGSAGDKSEKRINDAKDLLALKITDTLRRTFYRPPIDLPPHPSLVTPLESAEANGVRYETFPLFERDCFDLAQQRPMMEREAKPIIRSLLDALIALEDAGLAHRDVKLENILVAKDGSIALCDFGFCVPIDFEPDASMGSPLYMAPEICQEQYYRFFNGTKVDVFGVGVCLCFLLLHRGVSIAKDGSIHYPSFATVSHYGQSFIQMATAPDPVRRASLQNLRSHYWLKL